MTASQYLVGTGFWIFIYAAGGLGGAILVRSRMGAAEPLARLLAWALASVAIVFVAYMVPGVLGILSRETVAIAAALALAACFWLVRPRAAVSAPPPIQPSPPAGRPASTAIAIVGAVAVAAYLVAHAITHAGEVLLQQDVTSFHLPNVARWIETSSFWQVDDFIPDRAPGNYPQSGDVFLLSAILPFGTDFLVRFVSVPFLALASLGTYGIARELSAPRSSATLFAAAIPAMAVVGYIGGQGLADPEMLGPFAAGGYFLLRNWRTRDSLELVLAGVGFGLAFGARWYAVAAVLAVLAVWAIASYLAGRERILRRGGLLVGLVALFGGFWLLRNLILSGNPVFPVRVAPFGIEIFSAPPDLFRELQGYSLSNYMTDPGIFREYLWEPFLNFMSWIAVALWAALAAAGVVGWRLRNGAQAPAARRALALVAIAAIIGVAYLITPYTATGLENEPIFAWVNARYVVPALLAGAAVAAWLVGLSGRARPFAEALVLIAVLDALRRSSDFPGGDVSAPALLAALVLCGGLAALVVGRGRFALPTLRAPALVAATAAGLILVIVAGRAIERDYNPQRYRGLDPTLDFINERLPGDGKIGIIGDGFGVYALFGPELENQVEYVGERVEEMLKGFESEAEFDAAIERGGYDLVFAQELGTLDPEQPPEERRWLEDLGFREVAAGNNPGIGAPVRLYAPPGSPFLGDG